MPRDRGRMRLGPIHLRFRLAFVDGTTAFAFSTKTDNGFFDTSTLSSGTKAEWLPTIGNEANCDFEQFLDHAPDWFDLGDCCPRATRVCLGHRRLGCARGVRSPSPDERIDQSTNSTWKARGRSSRVFRFSFVHPRGQATCPRGLQGVSKGSPRGLQGVSPFFCSEFDSKGSVLSFAQNLIDGRCRWQEGRGMPRQVRIEYEGAMYHVMCRGDRREAIFEDDRDRETFLRTLGEASERTGCGEARGQSFLLLRI